MGFEINWLFMRECFTVNDVSGYFACVLIKIGHCVRVEVEKDERETHTPLPKKQMCSKFIHKARYVCPADK